MMASTDLTLFTDIRYYLQMRQEMQTYLAKHPDEWAKFQRIFDLNVDKIYQDITGFEKRNIKSFEQKVYKLKNIFEKRYRKYFLHGDFIKWCLEKPFGYAGDFQIIDNIYQNNPTTTGFDRLWDNYFQQLASSNAIRERKVDFKKIIFDFVRQRQGKNIRIMNLASGSAREIEELLSEDSDNAFKNVLFDCYDFDVKAIAYARQLMGENQNVNFFQKNALRIALTKDIKQQISVNYDLIYSTGLLDYLDERVAISLVRNLRNLLKNNGMMVISNASDKYNNLSASWMEWVGEWYLIYRTECEFKKIFTGAGFSQQDLHIKPQNLKLMQYCFAKKP